MINHSPSSLKVDGQDKGRDCSMKGIKSNGQLTEDGEGFDGAEKISIRSQNLDFILSVVSFFMKFRLVIKMPDIE
jgi:hypothetical protein